MIRLFVASVALWAYVARAEPITGPYVMQPTLTAPVDQAYMRIDPTIKPQLDRIEKMLRAICEHSRHANGMLLNDDCKEPIP